MKKKIKRLGKKYDANGKEMFAGGLITAGIGAATTLVQNNQQEKADEKMKRGQFKIALKQREDKDESVLDTFPVDGSTDELYAGGGKLPMGNSKKLAANAEKVVNAGTHESGDDVQIKGANASVEQDEIILDGDKVLSERSGHADVAEGISEAKGLIESVGKDPNFKKLGNRETNAAKRTLDPLARAVAKLDAANDANFATQEQAKLNPETTTGEMAEGGKLKVGDVVPYLDNAVNLLQRTPDVIKPVTQEAAKLDTNVDISGDLNDIAQAEQAGLAEIEQGTSNSNVELARKSSLRRGGADARSKVRRFATNKKQELVNADRLNTQQQGDKNAAIENEYVGNKLARNVAINDKISANVANAAGDFRQQEVDDLSVARDERTALTIMSQNAASGANESVILSGAYDSYSDDFKTKTLAQLRASGRTAAADEIKRRAGWEHIQ